MKFFKATLFKRNDIAESGSAVFNVDDIVSPIRVSGGGRSVFYTRGDRSNKNTIIQNKYEVLDSLASIKAQTPQLVALTVIRRNSKTMVGEVMVFNAKKVFENIVPGNTGNVFKYEEERSNYFVEYEVSESLSAIYSQSQAAPPAAALIAVACSDETSPISIASNLITFHVPFDCTIDEIIAGVTTPTTLPGPGALKMDILVNGSTIFGTNKIAIDPTEYTSLTAGTPYDLVTTSLTKGDKVTIDVVSQGDNTATGLKMYFNLTRV